MKKIVFILIALFLATQGISQTKEELLEDIIRLKDEKNEQLKKQAELDALLYSKIRQVKKKEELTKKTIAKFSAQNNPPTYSLNKTAVSKGLSKTSEGLSKTINVLDSRSFKAVLSTMNKTLPNNQTVKDAKENAPKISEKLQNVNFGIQAGNGIIFADKESLSAAKSTVINKLKEIGNEIYKKIPKGGGGQYVETSKKTNEYGFLFKRYVLELWEDTKQFILKAVDAVNSKNFGYIQNEGKKFREKYTQKTAEHGKKGTRILLGK
jgi:hypothetical protein